jgi:hypothetical protein
MKDNTRIVGMIKEIFSNAKSSNVNLIENKKIEGSVKHATRYFGNDPKVTSNEINGKIKGEDVEATPGRGARWSLKRKPNPDEFGSSAFTHSDGRKLIPTAKPVAKKTIGGKTVFHQEFYAHDGKKTTLETHPITTVRVETKDTGKHNDEHALKHIWNHFSQNQSYAAHRDNINALIAKHGDDAHDHIVDYIHGHLSAAEKNRKHPLHIGRQDVTEFVHNIHGHNKAGATASEYVRERSKSSYHENLRNSALSFASMISRKEFRKAFDNDFEMIPTGTKKAKLSENAKAFGMKEGSASATYKSDVITLRRRGATDPKDVQRVAIRNRQTPKPEDHEDDDQELGVSVKKSGGSQIESPDANGFNVLYSHAIDKHYDDKHPTAKESISREHAHKLREQISKHMENNEQEEANKKLQRLHKHLDSVKGRTSTFTKKLWRAGITGEHKFQGEEGTANTILVQGAASTRAGKPHKRAKLMSADEYTDYLDSQGQLTVPQIGGSKYGKGGATMRMRVRD